MRRHNSGLYRSGLEDKIAKQLDEVQVSYEYEALKLPYEVPASKHTYTPDYLVTTRTGKTIIVEAKGIWDYKDRVKHLLIREQHPELDIRFVFSRSKSRISKGSKTTYGMICDGLGRPPFKGVTWLYADKLIPESWLQE